MIDVREGGDVETDGIPGAFLQTDYGKGDIHINMEGEMVNPIKDIDPYYYKDFIYIYIRGNKFMYAESKKAIYGTQEESLIFWTKLSEITEEINGLSEKWTWLVCH